MPSLKDEIFITVAVEKKLLSSGQVDELLNMQKVMQKEFGVEEPLHVLSMKKAFIDKKDVKTILREVVKRGGGGKMIGKYELTAKLGSGGMGSVYKAKQKSMNRMVALKILAPRLAKDKDFVKRFIREAQIAGQLSHPNIIRAIDVGEANGHYYFAMEYVKGKTLRKILSERIRIPEIEALRIARDIASALQHAHSHNVIHRDIKPDNIMITVKGEAQLLDLGIAKIKGSDTAITMAGEALGTALYISPEQASGSKETDIRADIYSLGATLYHALTGEPPFEGDNPGAIIIKHIQNLPVPPKKINPNISDNVEKLIMKMLQKKPDDRYKDPTALLEDIALIMTGHEIQAAPVTAPDDANTPDTDEDQSTSDNDESSPVKQKKKRRRSLFSRGKGGPDPKFMIGIIAGVLLVVVGVLFAFKDKIFPAPDKSPAKPKTRVIYKTAPAPKKPVEGKTAVAGKTPAKKAPKPETPPPAPPKPAPKPSLQILDLTINDWLAGAPLSESDLKNKTVVVGFATELSYQKQPARELFGCLSALQKKHGKSKLAIIIVGAGKNPEKKKWFEEKVAEIKDAHATYFDNFKIPMKGLRINSFYPRCLVFKNALDKAAFESDDMKEVTRRTKNLLGE